MKDAVIIASHKKDAPRGRSAARLNRMLGEVVLEALQSRFITGENPSMQAPW